MDTDTEGGSLQNAFLEWRMAKLASKAKAVPSGSEVVDRTDPERKRELRKVFLERAREKIGTPYARRVHEPSACTCEGCTESGRQLYDDPLHLDCCGLVRYVIRSMQEDLGFRLGPMNQSYQFDTLPSRVQSVDQLEAGDLIFYSGTYFNPDAKRHKFDMTHVEIFIGGASGEATIGSRERFKWVMEYDSFRFESKRWSLLEHFFVKIDPWLEGLCQPEHPELWKAPWGSLPGSEKAGMNWDSKRFSIFSNAEGQEEEELETADD